MELTAQIVGRVWSRMCTEYGTKRLDMPTLAMRAYLKLTKAKGKIMAMTLGKLIYTAFDPKRGATQANYEYRLAICAHEHQHAVDARHLGSFRWYWDYIFSIDKRLAYEVAAYCRDLELVHFFKGAHAVHGHLERLLQTLALYTKKPISGKITQPLVVKASFLTDSLTPESYYGPITKKLIEFLQEESHDAGKVPTVWKSDLTSRN